MFKIRQVGDRLSERKGQTMTEYAILLAGIGLATLAGYKSLGTSTNGAINSASQLLASGSGSIGAGSGSGGGSGGGGSGNGGDGGSGHHHHGGDGGGDGHHHHGDGH